MQPIAKKDEDRAPHRLARSFTLLAGTLNDDRVWVPIAALVMIFQLALVVTHQAWHDEYQALLIALQSPDMPALLANLHYEGHPPLWYLVLRGAAIVMPAAWVLVGVQSLIAIALQSLILFRAPASRAHRLLAATSYFVLIDYGMISRSLGLGILLFTASMLIRNNRAKWLAIALMPMTDFLFGVLSLVSIALELRHRRIWWPGLLLWAMFSGLAALSVTMPGDVVPALRPDSVSIAFAGWLENLSTQLIPFPLSGGHPLWDATLLPGILSAPVGIAFLILADRQLAARPLERTLLCGVIVATAGLSILVYQLPGRLLSVISWALILLRWQDDEGDMASDRIFGCWLGIASACGLIAGLINLAMPFDFSARAATFIERNHLQNEHWFAFPFPTGTGVSALTGIEFDRLPGNCVQSFSRWNYKESITSEAMLDAALSRAREHYGRSYLISRFKIQGLKDPRDLTAIASFAGAYDGHDLYLYKVGANARRAAMPPPRCAPTDRVPLALDGALPLATSRASASIPPHPAEPRHGIVSAQADLDP